MDFSKSSSGKTSHCLAYLIIKYQLSSIIPTWWSQTPELIVSFEMGSYIVQSGVLAAPLQVLLEKFTAFAQKEIGLILDAEDEFEKLKRSVMAVEALVDNVKQYGHHDEAVQLWLRDLRSVLHDGEDLLDRIDLELMKHCSAATVEVSDLVFSQFKLGIPHEMAKIRHRLEEMVGEKDGVFRDRIVKLASRPNYSIGKQQTSSLVDDSHKAMRRTEDVGKEYFDLLVSRSLFQLSHVDHNNHLIYKMHDLIHELAEFVSDGVCFKMENNNSQPRLNFKHIRHSSLVCKDIQPETWKVFHKCGRLRTFTMLHQGAHQLNQIPAGFFLNLRYMRVLNLSCTSITELPDTIGTLKHLRHFNVSNTQIVSLPESITKLCGLETLKLNNCFKFLHLPQDMRNLSNLRNLELDIKRQIRSMPPQFGKLTSLQTLSAFIVAEEDGQRIDELKNLRCLRGSICITRLENVTNNAEAGAAELDQKPHLDKVELEWNEFKDGLAEQEVLAGLQPHNRIKELIITGYGGFMFPSWLSSPSFFKLQSIYLHKCCKCTILPFLGQLPLLSSLYIHDMPDLQNVDTNFTGSSSMCFPSLLTLKFHNLPKLQNWTGLTRGNMPKLSKLFIESCPILGFLPSLQCLYSLETLDISRCPQLESLPDGNLPESLKSLIITECDILKQRCNERNSPDWIKIMSVANIQIDYQVIQVQQHHAD
ncbi:putative disease resistance RPP13-like protein 1 [Senna tora]|uniref:Putative disease resistance RPP13-like protein 1 n=1 Tax=Senna tora TaxID=362788 RepID=A0A834TT49_9FABA|nr:putative disease resistance RPP13-like protein 1 [Senna tora]